MKIRKEGSNRIVEIYNDYVFKIPKDNEAVIHNQIEFNIWNSTKHKYLCSCELIDNVFLQMEKVNDLCNNKEGIILEWLPSDFKELLKKHPKLEYGEINGFPKIYDYADCNLNWEDENPEDNFINDLLSIQ